MRGPHVAMRAQAVLFARFLRSFRRPDIDGEAKGRSARACMQSTYTPFIGVLYFRADRLIRYTKTMGEPTNFYTI